MVNRGSTGAAPMMVMLLEEFGLAVTRCKESMDCAGDAKLKIGSMSKMAGMR